MNSKYRDFMQRQQVGNRQDSSTGGDSMRQMFGNSPDNQKFTPPQFHKSKRSRNVEDIPIPMKEGLIKKGFILFGILLIIEAIFVVKYMDLGSCIGGILMAVVSFLLAKKVEYRYTQESNFYYYNLSVTLKGVLNHYRTTSILMEQSEKIFMYSVGLMAGQHFLLSWWFSLTSILYSVGYYGMLLGIILNLSKRKTNLLYKGFFLYSILLGLMTIENAFGGLHYVNFHTVISLFLFWYLGGLFKSIKISEIHINEKSEDEDLEIDINEQDEDHLI